MYPRTDETGNKYSNLTFLNPVRPGRAGEGTIWLLRCDCGTLVESSRKAVTRGRRKTCGKKECPHRLRRARNPKPTFRSRSTEERKQRDAYSSHIYAAARKNLSWSISPEAFRELTKGPCTYCGITPDIPCRIDRLHPDTPFTPANSVPACHSCIRMKSGMSFPDFLQNLDRIHRHLRELANTIPSHEST